MRKIINRAKKPAPKLFKNIQKFGISLTALGGTLIGLPEMVPTLALPAMIGTIGGYCIAAGIVMAAISKLPNEGE